MTRCDTFKLSDILKDPNIIDGLKETDSITVDISEAYSWLYSQKESFIKHADSIDKITNLLATKAACMDCYIGQFSNTIPGERATHYDSLAFMPRPKI
jgi:hypothetical protein